MAGLQPTLLPCTEELQLLPSRSSCNHPRASRSRGRNHVALQVKVRQVSFLSFTPAALGFYRVRKQKPLPGRGSTQFVSSLPLRELNSCQACQALSAKDQSIFGGAHSVAKWFAMSVLPCNAGSVSLGSYKRSPIAKFKDKFNKDSFKDKFTEDFFKEKFSDDLFKEKFTKGFRKLGRRGPKLEERIQEGFRKVGLERQFGELPKWSAYVPLIAGGLEAAVIILWTVFFKGNLRGANLFNLSGEGLLTLLLGTNFVVGWLASQKSTWRVEELSPSLIGREKKAASPGVIDFMGSFGLNLLPYGNFLAWTRFGWKENSSVSSLNAVVYVVPSLLKLVLWSQGMTIGKVELLAWVLGAIHRPYDAARVQNEKVLTAADARIGNARKAKEEKEREEKGPELTAEEMVVLQQRKELEEFDILLARSTNSTASVPGLPQDWSVGDTVQWLGQEGFARYAGMFAENDIDGSLLLLLTADDLRDELGIQSLGDRRRLVQAIQRLK